MTRRAILGEYRADGFGELVLRRGFRRRRKGQDRCPGEQTRTRCAQHYHQITFGIIKTTFGLGTASILYGAPALRNVTDGPAFARERLNMLNVSPRNKKSKACGQVDTRVLDVGTTWCLPLQTWRQTPQYHSGANNSPGGRVRPAVTACLP